MISYDDLKKKLLAPLDNQDPIHDVKTFGLAESEENRETISLQQYVSNPTGSGTAYVANRAAIKQGLNLTFIKLLRNFRTAFYAVPYLYDNGDILYHVKVPSEDYKFSKISYDVMFLIKYDKFKILKMRDVQFFSNCPSFLFTYCYVYNKKGLLIDSLKVKLSAEALNNPPEVRNPIQSMGYEKSTYIAARYLMDGMCLTDSYLRRFGRKLNTYSESALINKITDAESIVSLYQFAKYNQRKQHKKELTANEKKARDEKLKAYAQKEKANKPKGHLIVSRGPRAKLTARKARKIMFNKK